MNKLVLDLSQHNGNVNMTKVKNAGVYGIIQRVGYGTNTLDNTAYANMDNALANSLKVGAYWFVYATNVKEAVVESNNFINMIKRYDGKLELPLFIDFEYDTERYANQVGVQFTKQLRTDMIEAFCNNLEKQGYYAGIYANIDYLNNKFDSALINKYNLWVAHWNDKNNSVYANKAGLWQYTSTGKIDGINGNVDCNKMLIDYPTIIKKAGLNGFKMVENTAPTTPVFTGKSSAEAVVTEAKKFLGVIQGTTAHKNLIDTYNSISPLPVGYKVTYTDSWCDVFVSVIFRNLGLLDLIGGGECGVERHIQIFKNLGIWIEDGMITPKVGDIITYNWDQSAQPNDGFADHIGIVETVSGKTITIIEGNVDSQVGRTTTQVGNGYIRGYARPKYATVTSTKKSNEEIAKEVWAGKWGNGTDRTSKLKAAGYDPVAIQKIVEDTNPNKVVAPAHVSKSGTWRFNTTVNIRSGPSTNDRIIAQYNAGDTVNINSTLLLGGYIWGKYVSFSGHDRYVALEQVGITAYGKWV